MQIVVTRKELRFKTTRFSLENFIVNVSTTEQLYDARVT